MSKKKEPEVFTVRENESIYGDSLQSVIERADELMKRYPETLKSYKDFYINMYDQPYSDSSYSSLEYKRPETPKETAKREKEAKEWAERQAKYEQENYLRLKAKFEKGNK